MDMWRNIFTAAPKRLVAQQEASVSGSGVQQLNRGSVTGEKQETEQREGAEQKRISYDGNASSPLHFLLNLSSQPCQP